MLLAGYRQDPGGEPPPEEAHRGTVWDVKTGKRLQELKGHDGNISFVGFLPDSKRAITAGGSTIKMWDAREGKQLWSAKAHAWLTACAALSPDGKYVLSWGYEDHKAVNPAQSLNLCDAASGKLIREFDEYKGQMIQTLRFAPDSRHAFIDRDPRMLDVTTGRTSEYYKKGEEWKSPLAFAPSGKLALSERHPGIGQGAYLALWDLTNAKEVRRFEDYSKSDGLGRSYSHARAFTPDGKRVLSGDFDGRVRVWETASGKLISSVFLLYDYPGRKGPPERLVVRAFSPDGKMALTSSEEKPAGRGYPSIRFFLWDVHNGKLLQVFQPEPGTASSPD